MAQIDGKTRAERVAHVRQLLKGAPTLDEICAARHVLIQLLATKWAQQDNRRVLALESATQVLSDAGWAEEEA